MQDNGRAAIIVGGKMWSEYWKPLSETSDKKVLFGKWKSFLGYLYAQYNVEDVVYINSENIYYKQGTQFPIVVILINGRHAYDESNKPRYVFNSDTDTIINNFDELYSRISPYIIDEQPTPPTTDDDKARKRKLLILAQAKIKIAKAKAKEGEKREYKVLPLPEQYVKIKEKYNDSLLAIGNDNYYDFYGADAEIVARLLNREIVSGKCSIHKEYLNRNIGKVIKNNRIAFVAAINEMGGIDEDGLSKYKKFIKDAINSKSRGIIDCTELISASSKRIVNNLLKKNITNYYIKANDLRHSKNKHGRCIEYQFNQIPITEYDLQRLPDILANPTSIDLAYSNSRNGQGVRFIKEYPDGKIFCVMIDAYEVEELTTKTIYKKPPLQGNDANYGPKHNVLNAQALPMLSAKVVNFFRIK